MSVHKFHSPSLIVGIALAAMVLLVVAQKTPEKTTWEYRIIIDATEEEIAEAATEGWEYVGYLGEGTLGVGSDESLWRRPE